MAERIHPTAIVDSAANLAPNVEVGPYAIIEAGSTVGANCRIGAHAVIRSGTVLEERVTVDSFSVVGGLPQDLSFDPQIQSGVRIESGTVLREHVTVHRSTHAGGFTVVGANCLLMAASHVGHDSHLNSNVILANNVMLAGHVSVGAFTFVGGGAGVHQFCRIGESVMISGLTRLSMDAAPYCMVSERNHLSGLNLVGLKRRKFDREAVVELKEAYRTIFGILGNQRKLAEQALTKGVKSEQARQFLEFFLSGKRGFASPQRGIGQ